MMTNNLMDAQISLLQSGLQRSDCRVVAPKGKVGPAKNLAVRMIDADWLKAIRTMPDASRWRRDEPKRSEYSLKLTTFGLTAVSASQNLDLGADMTAAPGSRKNAEHNASSAQYATVRVVRTDPLEFREGSKLAAAAMLLRGDGGNTIKQFFDERNWLPLSHSPLAMLTGLCQLGASILGCKTPDIRTSAYAIEKTSIDACGLGKADGGRRASLHQMDTTARHRCRLQSDRSFCVR